jgi:hypothetical protein
MGKGLVIIKKMILAVAASFFLLLSVGVSAEPAVQVLNCKLNDGMTSDDAHAPNAKWLKWAHAMVGNDEITSSFVSAIVGDFGGFMWVDSYPSLAVWATIAEAELDEDDPKLSAAFDALQTCSSSLLRPEQTELAK